LRAPAEILVGGEEAVVRLLFTAWAWPSHLYAMTPLAWACRAGGHEVRFAGQPGLVDAIVRSGLPAVTVGNDVDSVELVRGYALAAGHDVTVPTPRAVAVAGAVPHVPRAVRMLEVNAKAMVDDLVTVAREWRPDLIVFDPTAWAGPLAAAVIGVPAVRHLYGLDLMGRMSSTISGLLAPMADRWGLGHVDVLGEATIDPLPPGLRLPGPEPALPVRYVPSNGGGRVPPVPRGTDRPRICVSWGHTMARLGADRVLAGPVAAAMADLDADVVVAVSSAQRPLLGEVPPGVRVVVDQPLHTALVDCDLVVAHGGAGTVLTALSAGVPLLLVPQLPDHAAHARQVAAAGAGVVLGRADATRARLSTEASRMLSRREYRAAAGELGRQMAGMPPPAALVPELVALAAAKAPRDQRKLETPCP
jgi:UDP:flavonoid glycosyltransferase YjiC (YdhE family)